MGGGVLSGRPVARGGGVVGEGGVGRSRRGRREPRRLDERADAHARLGGVGVRGEAVDDDAALVGLEQAEQHAHGGRLAGPIRSEKSHHLGGVHLQIERADHVALVVALGQYNSRQRAHPSPPPLTPESPPP